MMTHRRVPLFGVPGPGGEGPAAWSQRREMVGEPADGPLEHVLTLGGVDATRTESADVLCGFEQHDPGAFSRRHHGCCDATRDSGVNDDIEGRGPGSPERDRGCGREG